MECLLKPIHGQIWGDVTKARERQVHEPYRRAEAHPDQAITYIHLARTPTATLQGEPKNEASMATRC